MADQPLTSELLERRRRKLGISKPQLAQRSRVSIATVQRLLGDQIENTTIANVRAVADTLGVNLTTSTPCTSYELQEREALAKAENIAALVQGTSALECQAVSSEIRQQMVQRTVHELMAGSKRRLWST